MYMLYRSKAKSSEELDNLRMQFEEIYKKHKVDIVGFWVNAEDESEAYYMSKYENEDHYKKTVETLRRLFGMMRTMFALVLNFRRLE
jgi:hypothetical protein